MLLYFNPYFTILKSLIFLPTDSSKAFSCYHINFTFNMLLIIYNVLYYCRTSTNFRVTCTYRKWLKTQFKKV